MKKARALLRRYLASIKGDPAYLPKLLSLLRHCQVAYLRKDIARIILRYELTASALYIVISSVPSYRLRAWRRLKQLATSDIRTVLVDIIREVPSLRKKAFERLVSPDPCTNKTLIDIMHFDTPAALWAWRLFEINPFSREELIDVVENACSRVVGRYAWERYSQIHTTQDELEKIIDGGGRMKIEAAALLVELYASEKRAGRKGLLDLHAKLADDSKEFKPILETIREMLATYEGDNRIYRVLSVTDDIVAKETYLDKIRFNKPTRDDLLFVAQASLIATKKMAAATELLNMRPLAKHLAALLDSKKMLDLVFRYLQRLKKISPELLDVIDRKYPASHQKKALIQKHISDPDYLFNSLITLHNRL